MKKDSTLNYGVLLFLSIGLFGAASAIMLAGLVLYAFTYIYRHVFADTKEKFSVVMPS